MSFAKNYKKLIRACLNYSLP